MRMQSVALFGLLSGLLAVTASSQPPPYGSPPGNGGQYEPYQRPPAGPDYRQPDDDSYRNSRDDSYRRPGDDYDRDEAPSVDVGFFYGELSPYGEWIRHPRYGWAWFPRHVQAGWRPYSLGRWVESEYGWTWVSDEPFGWATYHYGRWAWDGQVGWLWVPGTDWGPAWVAWQQGNGYVGWAPLPPAVGFEAGIGIRLGGFNLSIGIAARDYSFVEEGRFLDSRIGGSILPQARNVTIINNTTNITDYSVIDNRVINRGVAVERIERATGRRAQRMRVANAPNPHGAGLQRDVLNVYRPPQRTLETVRVGRRNNAGLPQVDAQPNRSEAQVPTLRPPGGAPLRPGIESVPIPVAPRAKPAARADSERQFAREQRDLRAKEDNERRTLEQLHRQEMAQARARANAQEVQERHAVEMKEQGEQRQRSEQQLRTRQQLQRQAAKESEAKAKKPRKPQAEPRKPNKEKQGEGQPPPQ